MTQRATVHDKREDHRKVDTYCGTFKTLFFRRFRNLQKRWEKRVELEEKENS